MAGGITDLQTIYDDVIALQQAVATLQSQMSVTSINIADLQDDVTGLRNDIADVGVKVLTQGADIHALAPGKYYIPNATVCATILNKPTTSTSTAFIEVFEGGDSGQITVLYMPCKKADATYYHCAYYSGAWGEWNCVNLIDSGWIDLPLASNVNAYSEVQKPRYRRIGKEVFLSGVCTGLTEHDSIIGTLPSGYRPSKKVIFAVGSVGQIISRISIENNGEVRYNRSTLEPITAENYHSIACNFNVD